MTQKLPWILFCGLLTCVPLLADAAFYQVEFPLAGHNGYRAAKGYVTFSESIGNPKREDGTSLLIEVSNVPLPPGTELIVYVHEKEVGTIKLNKDRGGKLLLESKTQKSAPRIKSGSFVTLKLDDGSTVIW